MDLTLDSPHHQKQISDKAAGSDADVLVCHFKPTQETQQNNAALSYFKKMKCILAERIQTFPSFLQSPSPSLIHTPSF